jgi:hypothetical protein
MWIEVNNAHPNKLVLGVGNNAERERMENDHSHYFEYFVMLLGGSSAGKPEDTSSRSSSCAEMVKWMVLII